MDRKEGCGRPRVNVTSLSPLVATSLRLMYQMRRGLLRMMSSFSSPLPITASQVHFTSALVKGLPSCHFTPWRSLKVSLVLSSFHAQLSARSGTIWSGLLTFSLGSNITRLLNTAMNGWMTEIVASSWIEALGGLSRWEIFRVPPCFWAKAGAAANTNAARVPAANATRERIDFSSRRRAALCRALFFFPVAGKLAQPLQRPSLNAPARAQAPSIRSDSLPDHENRPTDRRLPRRSARQFR